MLAKKTTIKRLKSVLLFLFTTFFITSCFFNFFESSENPVTSEVSETSITERFTVIILDSDGLIIDQFHQIERGTIITEPDLEEKPNHDFIGWFNNDTPFSFPYVVEESIIIIARFKLDYAKAFNFIKQNQIKTNVEIFLKNYSKFGPFNVNIKNSSGSGVIFAEGENEYWVLTNYHVIAPSPDRDYRSFKISDYKGNIYTAYLYEEIGGSYYDLATVYFRKGKEKLATIKYASGRKEKGEDVISLGQPDGKKNTITFGQVIEYGYLKTNHERTGIEKTFEFACLKHTAYTYYGSSGGALLNNHFNLAGINVAMDLEEDSSWAIPIQEVLHYLKTFVYV